MDLLAAHVGAARRTPCAIRPLGRDLPTCVDDHLPADPLTPLLEALRLTMARCLRARFPDAAEDMMADLLQEGTLHVIDGVTSCRASSDTQLQSWACVVAIRAGLAYLRAPRSGAGELAGDQWLDRAAHLPEADDDGEGTEGSTLALLARLAAEEQLALPEQAQALLWERVIARHSWQEVAEHLGTTPGAVKRRYQRAQDTLRELLWRRASRLEEPRRAAVLTTLKVLTGGHPPRAALTKPSERAEGGNA